MITHALVLTIQALAVPPYTAATVRMIRRKPVAITALFLGVGLACDAFLGIAASLWSDLGENPGGVHWDNPLLLTHIVTASVGMFGFLVLWILLLLFARREGVVRFASRAVWIVFPCWMVGVIIGTLNVFCGFY